LPRVAGIYSRPTGIDAVPNNTIDSGKYNSNVGDVEADLNLPRPIIAGGTGATNATDALINLGAVAKAGDTMTGDLTINKVSPGIFLIKTAADQINQIVGYTGASPRWRVVLGYSGAEGGGDAGSDFRIESFTDAGAFKAGNLTISRVSGLISTGGPLRVNGQLIAAITSTTGTIYFGDTANGKYIDHNGTVFSISGPCNVAGVLNATANIGVGTGGTTGIVSFGNTGTVNLAWNAANFNFTAPLIVNGTVTALGNLVAQSSATVGVVYFGNPANARYFLWDGGNYAIAATSGNGLILNATGALTIASQGYKPGGGPWADSSDARIKDVIGEYNRGLDDVLALRPVLYTYKGNDTREPPSNSVGPDALGDKSAPAVPYKNSPHYAATVAGTRYIGLIAQEVEPIMPEMVDKTAGYIDGVPVDDIRNLDTTALIFALVNSVKTLAARVAALESAAP
jgi:hypothetical protein